MSSNCIDCRPARKCRSIDCDGTPEFGEHGFCRDCADLRADIAHDEAKDARLEHENYGEWDF